MRTMCALCSVMPRCVHIYVCTPHTHIHTHMHTHTTHMHTHNMHYTHTTHTFTHTCTHTHTHTHARTHAHRHSCTGTTHTHAHTHTHTSVILFYTNLLLQRSGSGFPYKARRLALRVVLQVAPPEVVQRVADKSLVEVV